MEELKAKIIAKIRWIFKTFNITAHEFGLVCGYPNPNAMNQLLNGSRSVTNIRNLWKFWEATGLPIVWWIDGSTDEFSSTELDEIRKKLVMKLDEKRRSKKAIREVNEKMRVSKR